MSSNRRSKAATLTDVARAAGVSTAVVSYVINDGPRPVAPQTRERVLAAAAALDYRPNRVARALRSRETGVVGLVVTDASNPYFAALGRHIEHALDARGKLTLIGNGAYSPDRQKHLVEQFLAAQVDGLVVVSADGSDVAARTRPAGIRVVYVHSWPRDTHIATVGADNDGSVHRAVAHLRDHGHTRIAFLAGPDDAGPVGERHAAWRSATHGTSAPLLRSEYSRASAADLLHRLIDEGCVPPALITATDEQAIGILAAAAAADLRIPDDLALISLDGTPGSAYTAPALAVTEQPLHTMARQTVDLLLDDTPPRNRAVQAPLIPRRSCGCATT